MEALKLKHLVDQRSRMFDMLSDITERFNQTAQNIIWNRDADAAGWALAHAADGALPEQARGGISAGAVRVGVVSAL
jgi:hypothetical protein